MPGSKRSLNLHYLNNLSKHIVFLSSRLDEPGGTERANLNAAHLLSANGHQVTLIILDETAESFYPIDKKINVIHKPFKFGISDRGNFLSRKLNFIREIIFLRRLLISIQPDIVIATDYPYAVAAVLGQVHKRMKVYSWEHHHYHWIKKSALWKKFIRRTYPKLTGILCYNPDETEYYRAFGCKTFVIPNFLTEGRRPINYKKEKLILTVGWLVWRKGVDLIPAMAKKVFEEYPDWRWKIIGTGELKSKLLSQIKDLQLQNHLIIEEPQKPLLASDYQPVSIFVMTSRLEPFGLVLIEAMNNSIPAIAFDCPTGPRHIIKNNEDGFLIETENTTAMAAAITLLIKDEERREQMAAKAAENVQHFSADRVYRHWEKLLSDN